MQKKEIQPFISVSSKNIIYRLNFITGYSVKQICDDLCTRSLRRSKELGEELSIYFKKEIRIGDTLFVPIEKPLKQFVQTENVERITAQISVQSYDFVYSLSHALRWSVAKVVAYCIERSLSDYEYMEFYVGKYLESKIDDVRRGMLLTMMSDINKEIPEEDHSISSLLLGIVDELKQAEVSVSEAVGSVAERW